MSKAPNKYILNKTELLLVLIVINQSVRSVGKLYLQKKCSEDSVVAISLKEELDTLRTVIHRGALILSTMDGMWRLSVTNVPD